MSTAGTQSDTVPVRVRSRRPLYAELRQARGLSLRETARRAAIDPAHLSRVERGETGLGVDALARLASVLGLDELARVLAPYVREDGTG